MNSYELSRTFFDWSFENPEKITPTHVAMYFFIIEHCNRLGWKEKFGLPTTMVKEAIGIKNFRTYTNTLNELVEWGFIVMVEKSKNQYSSNIVAIAKNTIARTKALDKALQKHHTKHCKSIDSIDKQLNKEQDNVEPTDIDRGYKFGDRKIEDIALELFTSDRLGTQRENIMKKYNITDINLFKEILKKFNIHKRSKNQLIDSDKNYTDHLNFWMAKIDLDKVRIDYLTETNKKQEQSIMEKYK